MTPNELLRGVPKDLLYHPWVEHAIKCLREMLRLQIGLSEASRQVCELDEEVRRLRKDLLEKAHASLNGLDRTRTTDNDARKT